jgi:NADPH-dependent 2,4-dienoyl-CoA reductase/sulfur reductase-like enzyme
MYDLVVIGTGPGGYVGAIRAAQLGMKVAVVEKRAAHGGTCLNVGCIPSKALLHASELFEEAEHAFEGMGIKVSKPKADIKQMLKFKDEAIEGNTKGIEFLLKKNKVDAFHGTGKILSAGKVEVTPEKGEPQVLETKNICIATGSDVARLPGIEIDEKTVVSSTGALELDKVPGHLVVVGAGVIGLGAWLGVAAAGRKGHRGRVPRPYPAGHGFRGGKEVPGTAEEAGLRLQAWLQGDRRVRQVQEGRESQQLNRPRAVMPKPSRRTSFWWPSGACHTRRVLGWKRPA